LSLCAACRTPLSSAPGFHAAGSPSKAGAGLLSAGAARGDNLCFASSSESGAGAAWNVKTATSSADSTVSAARASDGALAAADLRDPKLRLQTLGSAGARKLFLTLAGAPAAPLSSAEEDVESFDYCVRNPWVWVAWCARGNQEKAVRFARVDSRADAASSAPLKFKSARVPLDSDRPILASPSIAPFGTEAEGGAVVAYSAAPRPESPPEVRVLRVLRLDDGSLRAGTAKPLAPGFVWSRAPHVWANSAGGLVVFEGLAAEGELAGIFGSAINSLGDPVGAPIRLLTLAEPNVVRAHARPYAVGQRWFLAYEESRRGAAPDLMLQPLAVD
jgi:hypothetical protein